MMKDEIGVNNTDVKTTNMKWGTPKSEFTHIDKNKIIFNGIDNLGLDETICENKKLWDKDI